MSVSDDDYEGLLVGPTTHTWDESDAVLYNEGDVVYDDYGYPDTYLLSTFVEVLNILTEENAVDFILLALQEEASDVELERLRIAVTGPDYVSADDTRLEQVVMDTLSNGGTIRIRPPPNIGPPAEPRYEVLPGTFRNVAWGGASGYAPTNIDDTNPYFARFFEFVDAVHDFADHPSDHVMRNYLLESIKPSLPNGFEDLENIRNPNKFIEKITSLRQLTFIGVDSRSQVIIANPLHCRNMEAGIKHYSAGSTNVVTLHSLQSSRDMQNVDLFFKRTNKNSRFVTLDDIVQLRKIMDKFFTGANIGVPLKNAAALNMMLDNDMHPYQDRGHCHLVAWMTRFNMIVELTGKFFEYVKPGQKLTREMFMAELQKDGSRAATISFKYCDATLHDGGKCRGEGFTFSSAATGNVFHIDSEVQLEFVGPNDASTKSYGYNVKTTRPQYNPIDINDDTIKSRHRAISGLRYTEYPSMRRGIEPGHSKVVMKDDIMLHRSIGKHGAVPAAIKRAGDWGQIEHCKQNGIIFVTADRISALYAAYRDVPVLLVKHHDTIKKDATSKYVQYSFCMCGSDVARRALLLDQSRTQSAGGIDKVIMNVALAVSVVVCSFLSSLHRIT